MQIESNEPIHEMFGLTYSSWLVWSRAVMQAMPVEWQGKFVALAEELNEKFPDWHPDGYFQVSIKKDGKFTKLPPELCNYRRPVAPYLPVRRFN